MRERGLAHLPRPGHDLQEPAWLGQASGEFGRMPVGRHAAACPVAGARPPG